MVAPGESEETIPPGQPLTCDTSTADVGAAPLRRLSRREYLNTVRDLFPGLSLPALALNADKSVDGFNNNEATHTATAPLVDSYNTSAKAIAQLVEQSAASVAGCGSADAACAQSFARSWAARAFRRPLSNDEEQAFSGFMTKQVAAAGFDKALGLFVEGLLQSANFLYRPELGVADASQPARVPLAGYELASRLSYFITQSMPDATLLDAASRGSLATPAGVESEARRLLATPGAQAALADFHGQWLELDAIKTMARDPALFPAFSTDLPAQLFDATQRFVMNNFWAGDASLKSLLLDPRAYVNDAIAPLYGVPKPGSKDLTLVNLDPAQRAGLLTQAGLMASMSHPQFSAPIIRGTFVLRHLMCAPPPPPPPSVPDIPPQEQGDRARTTRQRVEELHVTSATCKACHASIDPLGFAFEHYDALGQYRTQDNGLPVDSSGVLSNSADVPLAFADAVELSAQLAESVAVTQCAARNMFRFSLGRTETAGDQCTILGALDAAKGNLRELVVQLALSDSFRYRKAPAAQ